MALKVNYQPRAFVHHVRFNGRSNGLLPDIIESHALWAFLIAAHAALENVPNQATYEGDVDQTVNLRAIAEGFRKAYAVESLDAMFNPHLIAMAKREALRCGMKWDTRLDAWFITGGKSYDEVTRDPDAFQKENSDD